MNFDVIIYYINGSVLNMEDVTCIADGEDEISISYWVTKYEIGHRHIARNLVKNIMVKVKNG